MKRITLISQKLRRFAHREDGGALAELAILAPFLAILLAGVTEFGRYFQTYTTLSKSTRTAARYLSNHPYTDPANATVARNLVVCGKSVCTGGDELVTGITTAHVCIQYNPVAPPETVTVSIPRTAGGCGSPYTYQPIFDLGALFNNNNTFSMVLPINPSNTMYYMLNN